MLVLCTVPAEAPGLLVCLAERKSLTMTNLTMASLLTTNPLMTSLTMTSLPTTSLPMTRHHAPCRRRREPSSGFRAAEGEKKLAFTLLFAQLTQGCCDDKEPGLLGVGDNSALIYHGQDGSWTHVTGP